MAGVITHLQIGKMIYKDQKYLIDDEIGFYLGTIAPDSIMAKADYQRIDKIITHLRIGISSEDWYKDEYQELYEKRILEFINKYYNHPQSLNSFYLGYITHLLTDQYFHNCVRKMIVQKLKDNNFPYTGKDLLKVMTYEFDAFDYYLLHNNQDLIEIIHMMENISENYEVQDLLPCSYIMHNFTWIKTKFIDHQENLNLKYFQESDILRFINEASNYIIKYINKYNIHLRNLIGKDIKVIIDRPIGYEHCGIIYQINYGYIEGLIANDGEEQDAYILGIKEPIKEFRGKVIAIIHRKNDVEDKLVVASSDNFSVDEIITLTHFQEKYFDIEVIK